MTAQQRADELEQRIKKLPPFSRKREGLLALLIHERAKALKSDARKAKRRAQ